LLSCRKKLLISFIGTIQLSVEEIYATNCFYVINYFDGLAFLVELTTAPDGRASSGEC